MIISTPKNAQRYTAMLAAGYGYDEATKEHTAALDSARREIEKLKQEIQFLHDEAAGESI